MQLCTYCSQVYRVYKRNYTYIKKKKGTSGGTLFYVINKMIFT